MDYLGKSVFEERLEDVYKYSIVDYLHGIGIISNDFGSKFRVNWELCVDVSGNLLFIISGNLASCSMTKGDHFVEYFLDGKTADNQWTIKFKQMIICSFTYNADIDANVCRCEIQGQGNIQIEKVGSASESISLVRSYLKNFYFKGIEAEKLGNSIKYNKFTSKADQFNVCFRMLDNSEKIKSLIDENRLQSAVFSCMDISKKMACAIINVEMEIDNITWFLSFLSLNTTFAPICKYLDASGNVIKIRIMEYRTMPYHNLSLFDNQNNETRYTSVFRKSYNAYKSLRVELALDKVVSLLLESQTQCTIESKLSSLIMAYELLLKKILLHNGVTESEMKNWNIQQKISRTNRYMKFIPANLLGDNLRDDIRNPLFHQGDIPEMSIDEKYDLYTQYLNLFVRIILRMLEYNGKYISRTGGYTVADV